MLGEYKNIDRRIEEPDLEPVDVLLFTLDAEIYLEKCLDSVYKEIPVNKVITLDGGSKDKTIEILKKYPRVEINVRPDIRTTGKGFEFILSQVTTPWVIVVDADITFSDGWYDEMVKYKDTYDFYVCKRIQHWEFYRVNQGTLDINYRPLGAPFFAKVESFKNYHVDDDYMWGVTDLLLRQVVEKNGYRFGKVATAYHYHHNTDNFLYESDPQKKGRRLVFQEPKWEILVKENWERAWDNYRKAIVKYLDPETIFRSEGEAVLEHLKVLDLEWVKKTNIQWYGILLAYKKKYLMRRLRKKLVRVARLIYIIPVSVVREVKKALKEP